MLVRDILRVKGTALYTVSPDTLLSDCVTVMADLDIGSLVVMDQGQLAGMLSFREVLRVLAQRQREHRIGPTPTMSMIKASEVMEPKPRIASPGMDVNDLRKMMLEHHDRYLPVMDNRILLGVVSFMTLHAPCSKRKVLRTGCLRPISKTGQRRAETMHILVSNDDGYLSPGLAALADAMRDFGSVTVVAPDRDRSGASNSLTLDAPLTVRRAPSGYYFINGTPTDCVHMAITGLLEEKPSLVVSGINNGPNMGDDTIYSGTVAAAMEGFLLGVPAIAFSLQSRSFEGVASAAKLASSIVERALKHQGLEKPYLFNVNIPGQVDPLHPDPVVTRLGKRHMAEPVIAAKTQEARRSGGSDRPEQRRTQGLVLIFTPLRRAASRSHP